MNPYPHTDDLTSPCSCHKPRNNPTLRPKTPCAAPANPKPPTSPTHTDQNGGFKLNRALHTIAITRTRHCPKTRAYIAKRISQGKTTRETRRCLKRYIARHLYRLLENPPPTPQTP